MNVAKRRSPREKRKKLQRVPLPTSRRSERWAIRTPGLNRRTPGVCAHAAQPQFELRATPRARRLARQDLQSLLQRGDLLLTLRDAVVVGDGCVLARGLQLL